jgi:hypothetical protein
MSIGNLQLNLKHILVAFHRTYNKKYIQSLEKERTILLIMTGTYLLQ